MSMAMVSDEDLKAALRVLEALATERGELAQLDEATRKALLVAAGRLARPAPAERSRLKKALRRRDRERQKSHDTGVLARTGMRAAALRLLPMAAPADAPSTLVKARACYICKSAYTAVHFFYDSLCPPCAELNFAKRTQTANLDGQIALVTGARVKIGYRTVLMLLRAGARVIATTRFPRDAARRYAVEPDFASWADRLQIHGIDLRHAPSVELFAGWLASSLPRLDVLVNNAAQTVRRPTAFYAHLLPGEAATDANPLLAADASLRKILPPIQRPELAGSDEVSLDRSLFPDGRLDLDDQQVDLRRMNSWRLQAADVPTIELLEVHLVNAIAPFLLASRLRPLMARGGTGAQHVINVSAMEAQFARKKKTDKHPHTNMAKAALNMLTRTSAADYAEDRIWMNSVDTGWVTDEDPLHHVERKQKVHEFFPPLDAIDGAARVLDPLFAGINSGTHAWGKFWKDYREVEW